MSEFTDAELAELELRFAAIKQVRSDDELEQLRGTVKEISRLVLVAAQTRDELNRIADRLDSWDVVYTAQSTGKEHHSLKTTANVYTQGR